MVQLSTEVQLIQAVCAALSTKSNVLDSLCPKTSKHSIVNAVVDDHKFCFASNRAQVVRSYTCVTPSQATFLSPDRAAQDVFGEHVGQFSQCIEHLAQKLTSSHE